MSALMFESDRDVRPTAADTYFVERRYGPQVSKYLGQLQRGIFGYSDRPLDLLNDPNSKEFPIAFFTCVWMDDVEMFQRLAIYQKVLKSRAD